MSHPRLVVSSSPHRGFRCVSKLDKLSSDLLFPGAGPLPQPCEVWCETRKPHAEQISKHRIETVLLCACSSKKPHSPRCKQ